jgi:succinate dehydrogenase / fumarate reductase membrane anchor subunit
MADQRLRAPMRSPLGRAIGLGSAKEGVEHWWALRVTSIALVPLVLWFVVSVIRLTGSEHGDLVDWVSQPITAVLLVLLLIATLYHSALGLQVVIEDYLDNEAARLGLIIAMRLAHVLLAALGIFAVLRIAIGP